MPELSTLTSTDREILKPNFYEYAQLQKRQSDAMEALLNPACKYLLYGGAAAGGKSYFLRWSAIGLSIWYWQKYHIKNIPIVLFSEDYPTLRDRQIIRIKKEMPKEIGELKETRDEGYMFKLQDNLGGGIILLRNLDDPSKYASAEFAAIFVEELTKNKKDTFDDLRFRLRYPGISDTKFVGASNPGSIGHGWVKKAWVSPDPRDVDPEQSRFFFIRANYRDNKYISPEYVKQLEALPEKKRKAFMDGNWDIFEGQFFSEFNYDIHTCVPFQPKRSFIKLAGMDWGRTAPFAMLCSFIQPVEYQGIKFNRLWTYKEFYGTQKTPQEWAIIISNGVDLNEFGVIRADPAIFRVKEDGGRPIAADFQDNWKENGWKLQRADNDRLSGWSIMHNWLSVAPDGKPYWIISRNCSNLIRTLPELGHNDHTGKIEDVNTLGEDHAPDAVRYLMKHIKWVDGGAGIYTGETNWTVPVIRSFKNAVDLDKFATFPKAKRDWRTV